MSEELKEISEILSMNTLAFSISKKQNLFKDEIRAKMLLYAYALSLKEIKEISRIEFIKNLNLTYHKDIYKLEDLERAEYIKLTIKRNRKCYIIIRKKEKFDKEIIEQCKKLLTGDNYE